MNRQKQVDGVADGHDMEYHAVRRSGFIYGIFLTAFTARVADQNLPILVLDFQSAFFWIIRTDHFHRFTGTSERIYMLEFQE